MRPKFLSENLKGRDHSEELGVDGRIICIIMDLREIVWESVEWMHLAQERDQWRAVVNMVMNLWVP